MIKGVTVYNKSVFWKFGIFFILICLLTEGCKTRQVRNITSKKLPIVTQEFEVFSQKDLISHSTPKIIYSNDTLVLEGIRIQRKDNRVDTFKILPNPNEKPSYTGSGGMIFLEITFAKDSSIFSIDYQENEFFAVVKEFYPNGNIKSKGLHCYFGFDLGEWYHFDETGNLTSTENKDDGFDFSYKKVFKVCEDYNIPLIREGNYWQTTYIEKDDGKWVVSNLDFKGYGNFCCKHTITLDEKTGKEISNILINTWRCNCSVPDKWKEKVEEVFVYFPPSIENKTELTKVIYQKVVINSNELQDTLTAGTVYINNPEMLPDTNELDYYPYVKKNVIRVVLDKNVYPEKFLVKNPKLIGQDLQAYVKENFKYPIDAIRYEITGRVIISFWIDEYGKTYNIESLMPPDRQLGYGLDEEAKRMIQEMPAWTPAFYKGIPVKSNLTFVFNCDLKIILIEY